MFNLASCPQAICLRTAERIAHLPLNHAALASVHGVGKIEASLSDFYVVNELQGTYHGMMIAIPPAEWRVFREMALPELATLLKDWAAQVDLKPAIPNSRLRTLKTLDFSFASNRVQI